MRLLLVLVLAAGLQAEDRFVAAVRRFADNALEHGRDRYGPKKTPLFVDGMHAETHEPVRWKSRQGREWVLSDLGNQQVFFRTLAGLTALTGEARYKQAAVDATRYALDHLVEDGYLVWGGHMAYNASDDVSVFSEDKAKVHELKNNYPYYELMWEVDRRATRTLIETMWNGHIIDWATLDFNRHAWPKKRGLLWRSEYKGGEVFFWGKGLTFINAGADLYYAAAMLSHLGGDGEPLVWAKRLAHRYVETRNRKTGIGGYQFSQAASSWCDDVGKIRGDRAEYFYGEDFKGHLVVEGTLFPTYGTTPEVHPRIAMLVLGEMLGEEGREFIEWAREEMTAWGKSAYRAEDNSFIPMLTDGTSMEGYVVRKDGYFGPKGRVLRAGKAGAQDYFAYALGARVTGDEFLLQMANRIRAANRFEEGADALALLGYLEMWKKTGEAGHLRSAERVGDNILAANRLGKGWVKFDRVEPLALLHLSAALQGRQKAVPAYNGGSGFFAASYGELGSKYDEFLYR